MKNKLYGELIKTIAERQSHFHSTFPGIKLPPVSSERSKDFDMGNENFKRLNFSVHEKDRELVEALAKKAWQAFEKKQYEESNRIVKEEIMKYFADLHNSDPIYTWIHMAYQMPDDLGINPYLKFFVSKYLSRICKKGVTLEAFAGFNSFIKKFKTNRVIATDYCREALERYPYPERERIAFDLNLLDGGNQIGDFEDNMFDHIIVCAGYKYSEKLEYVFEEFLRILKPQGALHMMESHAGYESITKRSFSPKVCRNLLKNAGFSSTVVRIFCKIGNHPKLYWVRAVK